MDDELDRLLEIIRRVPVHRADLTQNSALVVAASTGLQLKQGTSGVALTAGNACYYDQGSRTWFPAAAGGNVNASGNNGCFICINSTPGAGQPVTFFQNGQLNLGATLAVGETYVISRNSGKICPLSDLGGGNLNFTTILGIALNSSFIEGPNGGPFVSGVTRA